MKQFTGFSQQGTIPGGPSFNSSGLINRALQNRTPNKVQVGFVDANAQAPDPSHVNIDKQAAADAAYRQQALNQGGGGGMSVICTRYYQLGFLPEAIYKADMAYGRIMCVENPKLMNWYWSWAIPFVEKYMHDKTLFSRIVINLFWPICKEWTTEIAYQSGAVKKGSYFGKIIIRLSKIIFNYEKRT